MMSALFALCLFTSARVLAAPAPALHLPLDEAGPIPAVLSKTGAFADLQTLTPSPALQPYSLNVPFWSDGAYKRRWILLPSASGAPAKIHFHPDDEWDFPAGTVFVKQFELATDERHPATRHRLETRFIVRNSTGGVYGVSYKWRADGLDADLVTTNLLEPVQITTATGVRTQSWYYPGPNDCRTCHTPLNRGVLGVNTRQLNRPTSTGDGHTANQLLFWASLGFFDGPIPDPGTLPRLAATEDQSASLETRARSWLDANCAHCHRPGGTVAAFDARFRTPLPQQKLVDGLILIDEGIDRARVIAPHDPWRSILLLRVDTLEPYKMPPLARETVDEEGVTVLRRWIESLPGAPVLAPPSITAEGPDTSSPLRVVLSHPDRSAVIRYTLDGSVPGKSAPEYRTPLEITPPVTLRCKAYKTGYTRSITAQQTFVVP